MEKKQDKIGFVSAIFWLQNLNSGITIGPDSHFLNVLTAGVWIKRDRPDITPYVIMTQKIHVEDILNKQHVHIRDHQSLQSIRLMGCFFNITMR